MTRDELARERAASRKRQAKREGSGDVSVRRPD